MDNQLSGTYNPIEFETKVYEFWDKEGYFRPETQEKLGVCNSDSPRFCITIPPPNVTGVLHFGHAITIVLEDLMVRYARMKGNKTLFLVGSDHAGIATQNVVERELNKSGIERKQLGREKFITEVWKWKEQSLKVINEQSKKLGLSGDWTRERFTMDKMLATAVREAFVQLYERGLIYRGDYLINWCPGKCESAISDLEAEPKEVQGTLYTIKYPIKTATWEKPSKKWGSGSWALGAKDFIHIATTRPETLLGDSAVAISIGESKWVQFLGKTAILPIVGRELKILADEYVDSEFGTGALKITPAHDFNDNKIGKRHKLSRFTILNPDASIHSNFGGKYSKMDRFEARKAIVTDLKKEGLLVKEDPYLHSIPHCQRCKTVVEPRDSTQWFVNVKSLAKNVIEHIEAVKDTDDAIQFIPKKQLERLYQWINPETINEWCISRQLWWGHQIPIWYCDSCNSETTGHTDPVCCAKCNSKEIKQDEDVLDTWFSSGLWTFSTMGWPEKTADMDEFYPNTVRETGYDILFFWVARELMLGLELTGKIPYKNIYLHGIVRTSGGEKVSKSMENVEMYNPLNFIEKYGGDSVRFSILSYVSPGLDMIVDDEKFENSHKFGNKLWQGVRFILSNMPDTFVYRMPKSGLDLSDMWIVSEVNILIERVTSSIDRYNFLDAARELKRFFWNSFADWYIELSKRSLKNGKNTHKLSILLFVIEKFLKLLHPFMPYITEKLWQTLPDDIKEQPALIVARWPKKDASSINLLASDKFKLLQTIVSEIRKIRSEFALPPKRLITVLFSTTTKKEVLKEILLDIAYLAKLDPSTVKVVDSYQPPKKSISTIIDNLTIVIPLEGLVKIEEELPRVTKEVKKLSGLVNASFRKLNSEFSKRAPDNLVQAETEKLKKLSEKLQYMIKRKKALEE